MKPRRPQPEPPSAPLADDASESNPATVQVPIGRLAQMKAASLAARLRGQQRAFELVKGMKVFQGRALMAFGASMIGSIALPWVCVPIMGLALLLLIAATALRVYLILTRFTRYSLANLMTAYLTLSALVSLLVVTPAEWKPLPGLALACALASLVAWVSAQDPDGDNYMPPFVRERVIERRRLLREKAKQQKAYELTREARKRRSMSPVGTPIS